MSESDQKKDETSNATEPVDPIASTERLPKVPEGVIGAIAAQVGASAALTAVEEASTLPPSPEPQAPSSYELPEPLQPLSEEDEEATLSLSPLDEVGIGAETEISFVDVVISLCDAALEATDNGSTPGESLTGRKVAELFCQGDVNDQRVAFLLNLLAQDRPVTGQLVLAVARGLGFADYVEQALVTRQELAAVGGVAVEAVSVPVSFQGVAPGMVAP